jgi:hypothetical protein
MTEQNSEFIIKRGLTDNAKRKLILNKNYIEFEDSDLYSKPNSYFKKEEILEYKCGIRWMRYKFVFGREYLIYIRNTEDKILKINFKTYFGRKKKVYNVLFNEILDSLWDFHFKEIANDYVAKHNNGDEFYIGDVHFSPSHITIKASGILNEISKSIPWENIRTRSYQTYFAIYSEADARNVNRGYSYLQDWNTIVLYSVLRTLLSQKGIETYGKQ